jgi:hypothetical protein
MKLQFQADRDTWVSEYVALAKRVSPRTPRRALTARTDVHASLAGRNQEALPGKWQSPSSAGYCCRDAGIAGAIKGPRLEIGALASS